MNVVPFASFVLFSLFSLSFLSFTLTTEINQWPSIETDHTKVEFLLPESLYRRGGYAHKAALFGYPLYSLGTLQAQVRLLDASGCASYNATSSYDSPYVLLVSRGDCPFATKVRNAQQMGAQAVFIVDDRCLCSDSDCLSATHDTVCETTLPYMTKDDAAGDITIPSMLLRKSDGEAVKSALQKGQYVLAQLDWGIPSPDGRVEWTMWHSAWDETSLRVLEQLAPLVPLLGEKAYFTPRFVSYNGTKVDCRHVYEEAKGSALFTTNTPCGNMCLNRGRYCLLDPSPDHNVKNGASGSDVVTENLRRKCIWQYANQTDAGVGTLWWNYIQTFGKECDINEENFKDDKCAHKVMDKYHIPLETIEDCMGPYGENIDMENPLLEEEIREQTSLQVLRLPAVYVDGVHARGTMDATGILNMICAGYGTGQTVNDPPTVCHCAGKPLPDVLDCVMHKHSNNANGNRSDKYHFGSIVTMLVIMSAMVASMGYVYWKRSQRHMREQVRSILAEYMPLEDQSMEEELGHDGLHPAARAAMNSPKGYAPSRKVHTMDDDLEDEM